MATKKQILILIGLYLLSLAPRLFQLTTTAVYTDELTWMVNGKELIYALKSFNLEFFRHPWWNDPVQTYAIGLPGTFISGLFHVLFAGAGKYSLHLFSDLTAARLPLVIIASLMAPLMYHYLSILFGKRLALLSAVTYALNPIAIGLDRWLIHDSFLTLFCFGSLASYLAAVKQKKSTIIPGIFLALGFLTKPSALIVALVPLVVTAVYRHHHLLRLLLINLASFLVFILIFWPSSWFTPVISIFTHVKSQFDFTGLGINNFYFVPTNNPSWSYYFFQFFFKTPEIVLVFFFVSLLSIKKINQKTIWPIALFNLAYFAVVSISAAKSGLRYALPILPWLYVASVAGLLSFADKITRAKRIVIGVFILFSAVGLLNHPNHYNYYNLVIGGPSGAQKVDRVGFCFGSKKPLEYLDHQQLSGNVYIHGCPELTTFYTSRAETRELKSADYILVESAWNQVYPDPVLNAELARRQLIFESLENGVILGRLYH